MSLQFSIYVDNEEIYTGNFSEVPDEHRITIVDALNDWGEVLGKNGLNEMIYSLFTWYNQLHYVCNDCSLSYNDQSTCKDCGRELDQENRYQQNEKITSLLNCVGMITHLEISE